MEPHTSSYVLSIPRLKEKYISEGLPVTPRVSHTHTRCVTQAQCKRLILNEQGEGPEKRFVFV